MANNAYHISDLISMDACTGCQLCADNCPAVCVEKDGRLSGLYRLQMLKQLLQSRAPVWKQLFSRKKMSERQLRDFSDTVFRCTLCGNCEQVCPIGISLKGIWLSLRNDLVSCRCYPDKIKMIQSNLEESRNVFNEDNDERSDWVEDMPEAPDHGFQEDRAEVVYFTGCVSAYFPMVQKIPMALSRILDAAGVNFTLLGEDEWCCGFPLLGAGLGKDAFRSFIEHNIQAVRQKGASTVVFSCPTCYEMWKEHYPQEFTYIHAVEFIHKLIKKNRLVFEDRPLTVTYHDPCDLGRGTKVYDPPRKILASLPGVSLIELLNNRENCKCCGGGGNLEMIDADLSAKIAGQKMKEVLSTGASTVVTSCQQCVRTMNTYVKRNKIALDVMDVCQLVEQRLTTER